MSIQGIPDWGNLSVRVFEFFSFYGKVNGVGQTWVDVNGVRSYNTPREQMYEAISVMFEKLSVPLELVPKTFDGYPVVAEEIGVISALGGEDSSGPAIL